MLKRLAVVVSVVVVQAGSAFAAGVARRHTDYNLTNSRLYQTIARETRARVDPRVSEMDVEIHGAAASKIGDILHFEAKLGGKVVARGQIHSDTGEIVEFESGSKNRTARADAARWPGPDRDKLF